MMTTISMYANNHVVIGCFIRLFAYIALQSISTIQIIKGIGRTKFSIDSEQSKIKKLKNTYKGKRCFIICTGPSLNVDDLEMIKNEYTFAMNSISLMYDKTKFRPSFYGCIDEAVYRKMEENINKYDREETKVFISGRIRKYIKHKLPEHWFNVSCNVAYHTYDRYFRNKFWCRFSNDALFGTYDMYSVTHFLIQIAVYMGFSEIYLIGADCNQKPGEKVHFADYGVVDKTLDTSRERNICGYEEIKKYSENHSFKVFNATRGGMLEVFDRVELEDLFLKY